MFESHYTERWHANAEANHIFEYDGWQRFSQIAFETVRAIKLI
jgi:hypothetical protein